MSNYDDYIVLSAVYCRDLFALAREVFEANLLTERCVINNLDNLDDVAAAYKRSSNIALECKASLDEYEAIHVRQEGGGIKFDFDIQKDRLISIADRCQRIADLLPSIERHECVQETLWSDDRITSLYVEIADHVCAAIGWQTSSASAANLNKNDT